jgi:hypothetical protein
MPEEASLIITNSGVPGFVPVPGFLATGELALNWADGALYFKDAYGGIQSITVSGPPILKLDHIPVNEGPWSIFTFILDPINTAYIPVQKAVGPLPRLKIGLIPTGANTVEVDGNDITVAVVPGTTANQIKGLIESNVEANDLIYFYNAPFSDGTGITNPEAIDDASFINVNGINGDHSEYLGQRAFTTHTDSSHSEWTSVAITPTIWAPCTPGVIFNFTTSRWEKIYSQDGSFQSELLPDQEPIP